jgi:hypothetical protein
MRGKLFLVLLGFLIALSGTVMSGCRWEKHNHTRRNGPRIEGSGSTKTEQRSVGRFHGVRLEGIGKVLITQGDEESVTIEADDNVVDGVTTEVFAGILVIGMEDRNFGDVKVVAHVTVKEIEEVSLSGAGSIESVNQLQCGTLECSLTGVGEIELKGSCDRQKISLSGVGKIQNGEMRSEESRARVTGVGSCEVNATQSLDASVSGLGRIVYFGNPAEVKTSVSGLGSVKEG